jgi:hypothetical protein
MSSTDMRVAGVSSSPGRRCNSVRDEYPRVTRSLLKRMDAVHGTRASQEKQQREEQDQDEDEDRNTAARPGILGRVSVT